MYNITFLRGEGWGESFLDWAQQKFSPFLSQPAQYWRSLRGNKKWIWYSVYIRFHYPGPASPDWADWWEMISMNICESMWAGAGQTPDTRCIMVTASQTSQLWELWWSILWTRDTGAAQCLQIITNSPGHDTQGWPGKQGDVFFVQNIYWGYPGK